MVLFRLLALAAIWGSSFLFIKVGVEAFAPLQVVFGRVALGLAALLVLLRLRRDHLPRRGRIRAHLTVTALVLNTVPFTLFAAAEQRVPSALAGLCNAATPLFTVAFAAAVLPDERANRRRLAGLAVGFVGAIVVLGAWNGVAGNDAPGALMCLGAAACYGAGFTYARRYLTSSGLSPSALAAGQLTAATAQAAVLTLLFTDLPTAVPARSVAAVVALGVFCTGLAYVLQFGLIRDAGATMASTVTYLIPVFSIAAGVVVLGEHVAAHQLAGAAVIVAGAWLTRPQPQEQHHGNPQTAFARRARDRHGHRFQHVQRSRARRHPAPDHRHGTRHWGHVHGFVAHVRQRRASAW